MEKEGEREGVVSVASYIPSTMWGFPGTGGAERELKVVMPSTAGRKANRPDMGTVVLRLQYQAEVSTLRCNPYVLCSFLYRKMYTGYMTETFGICLSIYLNLVCEGKSLGNGVPTETVLGLVGAWFDC